jgi:hypothetical protein
MDTSLNKAQHKQELLCEKTFGSGKNVYVVEVSVSDLLRSCARVPILQIMMIIEAAQ